jgi:16S rRNA (uracil1498-N3)-methyltransferase
LHDRAYVPNPLHPGKLSLDGDEARHLARVRRAAVGDLVDLFDGQGTAYPARIVGLGKDRVDLDVLPEPIPDRVPVPRLTLATAIPKGDRIDWLVEKATELGIDRLVPLVTTRSVVDPRSTKLDRLRRTVIEACKQCGRNRLMMIDAPTPWAEFARSKPDAMRLLADPGGVNVATLLAPCPTDACLAIGPEGGFTDEEVELARSLGWQSITLGPTILRIETAGLVGAASIFNLCGRPG